ncbi:MAG: hypothetical protein JXR40_06285 [Pontiellaceae bacterium]|nr:hypothetical protein [Pontiellaceae bacterium]
MQNLEQKRAAHALEMCRRFKFETKNESDVVKPMTTMVLDCGMLPSMAYALDNSDRAHEEVFKAFIDYRGSRLSVKDYLEHLAKADSATLRAITAEFMAYVRYLRRFANMKGA